MRVFDLARTELFHASNIARIRGVANPSAALKIAEKIRPAGNYKKAERRTKKLSPVLRAQERSRGDKVRILSPLSERQSA